ncbi:MAG: carboxypeptidase M32, partial [Bacilli bacterium]|nr:carboxypeptidase M32 [Bacilli bacterium]
MTLDEKILRYEQHYRKTRAYNYALCLINFDGDTDGPKDAYEDRAEVLGTLSLEYFNHTTSQEYEQIINDLEEDYENLDEKMQRIVKLCRKNLNLLKKIPPKEYEDFSILVSKSNHVWKDAKEKGDFSVFEPYLEQVVEYQRKFAKYYGEIDGFIYNSLLDQYEEGATIA